MQPLERLAQQQRAEVAMTLLKRTDVVRLVDIVQVGDGEDVEGGFYHNYTTIRTK